MVDLKIIIISVNHLIMEEQVDKVDPLNLYNSVMSSKELHQMVSILSASNHHQDISNNNNKKKRNIDKLHGKKGCHNFQKIALIRVP